MNRSRPGSESTRGQATRLAAAPVAWGLTILAAACAPAVRSTAQAPLTSAQLAELWIEPEDIAARDLFHGPGGRDGSADPDATYAVTALDRTGYSAGYDVVGPDGRKWKVKLGDEAQAEAVASRVLWAIGFHQPPTYVISGLRLSGGKPDDQGRTARLRLEEGYRTEGQWSWQQNLYVGVQAFRGLLVANLILNNWDLKTSNNRVYQLSDAAAAPARRFVVQDLGASLGKTGWPTGNRNNVAAFESQRLIDGVRDGIVDFDYHGRHDELFTALTPADVVWTSRLLVRLSDEQWHDAFRAAAYPAPTAQRYIAKLKTKIQEGLALEARAAGSRP